MKKILPLLLSLALATRVLAASSGIKASVQVDTGSKAMLYPTAADFAAANNLISTTSAATTTSAGIVELATAGEVTTGTNNTRAVTPLSMSGAVAAMNSALRTGLAPRQGLIFDGTAGIAANGIPTPGANDFSVAAWFRTSNLEKNNVIVDGPFAFYIATDGSVRVLDRDGTPAAIFTGSAGVITTGNDYLIVFVRGKMYVNGSEIGTFTNSATYTTHFSHVGWAASNDSYVIGYLAGPYVYNRTLSDAEVLALYKTGAPAAVDNGASTTSLVTSDNSTFASDTGYWTKTGSATITGGELSIPAGATDYISRAGILTIGKKYRVTAGTITGQIQISDTITVTALVSGGSVEITAGGTALYVGSPTGQTGTLDSISIFPLGLLCAPEVHATGAGLAWNDASNNGAHLILPTSGVTWANPDSRQFRLRGTTSTNGNQQLHGATTLVSDTQILRVRGRARSGTPTITLGTSSGGAQIVSSVALSTTWKDLTIALTGGIVTSNSSVWVGSNSTDVVEVDFSAEALKF